MFNQLVNWYRDSFVAPRVLEDAVVLAHREPAHDDRERWSFGVDKRILERDVNGTRLRIEEWSWLNLVAFAMNVEVRITLGDTVMYEGESSPGSFGSVFRVKTFRHGDWVKALRRWANEQRKADRRNAHAEYTAAHAMPDPPPRAR